MCGIVGLFTPDRSDVPDPILVRRLNDAQLHRGPDEGSVHVEPHVALGHRRLSIIDVATGQQPLFNEDRSVVVVFNGEIYNFQELTLELEAAGHRFHTRSDTEVIVHGWEEWGADCVTRFRGMFAFALWDRNRKTLFMARDRLGVKPLHYARLSDGTWAFGSELKSLTAHPAFARDIDPTTIEDYLAFGYIPDPKTIWKAARKLAPAHRLLFRVGDEAPTVERWWDVRFAPDDRTSTTDANARLRELLTESVRMRLVSEVPLGAFLSGGVDSSAVVATMAGLSSSPVRTCSIAFDVPGFDESRFAQMVADRYRTDHYVDTVRSDDFGLIDTLVDLYDEPYADSSAIPTYRVCQLARRRVTVALSGDGGDETFGGYRRYRFHVGEERLRSRLPLALRRAVFGPLGRLYPKLDWMPRMFRAKTTFMALARDAASAYFRTVSVIRDEDRAALYTDAFRRELGGYHASGLLLDHAARAGTDDPLSLVQYIDYQTYLPGDINTKVDRASMAHSLEVREPLMDHRLVEWAATLPTALKLDGSEGKKVLKEAMAPLLPHDVLYRPKMGFSVPLASWFRGPLAARVDALVTESALSRSGWFDMSRLKTIADEHRRGRRDHSSMIWSLLMLDGFIDQQLEGASDTQRARSERASACVAQRQPAATA
jgi:asparagine synthase (glutamine-hydrolysing)